VSVERSVDLLGRLNGVRRSGKGWTAKCPAHEDERNSLSVHHRNEKWLLKCHAGCNLEAIIAALGLSSADLFDREEVVDPPKQPRNRATAQSAGLTLEQYAAAKALPVTFLRECGLSDVVLADRHAVRIPYLGPGGEELAIRYRIALDGDRFRWKFRSKPCLYGLNRFGDARAAGYVVVVEGESDVHTLWHRGIPAVGLPGATNWRDDRDCKCLDGIDTIYIVIEPDSGGHAVRKWLAQSAIRSRAKLLELPAKDPSALRINDPTGFKQAWQAALLRAVPWTAIEAKECAEERAKTWDLCAGLARAESILAELDPALGMLGLVGERRVAKLVYLALVSRLLDWPVCVALKGPSAGGKSFVVETVLRFFPAEAFYALTAMSDRALAYSSEPLSHRHLVIYEAAGMASDFGSYLIRSLLSERRLRYETVEKTRAGLVARFIEREGPTGLVVTTTRVRLHAENETRLLSLTVTDTREQTAAVFRALANGGKRPADLSTWQALQTWLAASTREVVIPYGSDLAEMVPPVAVRLRRDFRIVLTLISAHALLHHASRRKDADGRLLAEIADYAAVRELVADLIAEGADATIKPEIREVVRAVANLLADGRDEVRHADLKGALSIDKSAISRRVTAALEAGVLRNLEDRKGRPARLVLGDPLPEEIELLPKPERLHGCAVVGGDNAGPAHSGNDSGRAYCGKGELSGDPLLTASTDGKMFVAHRSCLDREAAFDRTSSDVTGRPVNGVRTPDLQGVAGLADGTERGSKAEGWEIEL
jgi:hypothetical protein